MKITLVCPGWKNKGLNSISFFKLPPQSLIQLASLTPLDWEVKIIDENNDIINFDEPTDFVGLTAMTALVPRAYEIAEEFRKRGVPTIMGGIHASMLPDEAIKYVDSVVIGEADVIWSNILDDFRQGNLKKVYRAIYPVSLDFISCREIKRTYPVYFSRYLPFNLNFAYIQTSRGCPVNCDFCSVTKFNGKRIRHKSIPYLLREIEQEKKNGFNYILFIDDNIVANKGYAKGLFQELKHLNVRWLCQTDIRIADEDVLDLACESGLSAVFLGLESISSSSLKNSVSNMKEHWRLGYEKAIRRLHDRGVIIEGSFIFGFDGDSKDNFKTTVNWAIENKIDIAQFSILTPLPGTSLFAKMSQQGRITTKDWSRFNTFKCVFQLPSDWTKDELENELKESYKKFYSFPSILKRINKMPVLHFICSLLTNVEFRRFKS